MTAFVESCVETVADSARVLERRTRHRLRAGKLLRLLGPKKKILITTHMHPDPDALASSMGLAYLLRTKLPASSVTLSFKGMVGGGLNEAFARLSNIAYQPWDDDNLAGFDAIILLDCQPSFAFSPLPAGVQPIAVIDHHRARGRKPACAFCDIRTEVGATSSLIFSYFMELETPIPRDLGASLLYAIESDLAGAAGAPGDLDNLALSSLTLIADPRLLYRMRYVALPASYYNAFYRGLGHAYVYGDAVMSHLDAINSLEQPAVIADLLLRVEGAQWSLVTAVFEKSLVLSLRTSSTKMSAADMMKRLVRNLGDGGGHRTKAGGGIKLETGSAAEIERLRNTLRRRYLRSLGQKPQTRGNKLVV
jgi:nanoRNase/pAp phosphatase (c-di-AMP/oligoRNAs hydrolase)